MWRKGLLIIFLACLGSIWGCGEDSIGVGYNQVASVREPDKPMLVVWGPAKIAMKPGVKVEIVSLMITPEGHFTITLPDGRAASWEASINSCFKYNVSDGSASIAISESGGAVSWQRRLEKCLIDIGREHAGKFLPTSIRGNFVAEPSAKEKEALVNLGLFLEECFKVEVKNLRFSSK